jgi:hypothetical protein
LRNKAFDQTSVLRELQAFRGGVADTSTLIYLDRLGALPLVARSFSLLLIPQVVAEYGAFPEGAVLTPAPYSGTTDHLLCRVAHTLIQPVLSEDKQVLRRARSLNLAFYNTLMIVLALVAQGHLSLAACTELLDQLRSFARYGPEVLAVGDQMFQLLKQATPD